MKEFQAPSNRGSEISRDRRIRLILWGFVVLLAGITIFAVYGARSASPQLNTLLVWLAGLVVASAVVGAQFLAFRHGAETVEHHSVFVLTDTELVRRRAGYPDVRIGFSEITGLYERPAWLLVESTKARKRIAIPSNVEGFAALRQELLKHGEIRTLPQPSVFTLIPGFALLVCWALFVWSKDIIVATVAGAAGLIFLAWECFFLYKKLRFSPHRILVWSAVTVPWLGVVAVLYFRLARH